jgi:hypothetical protein
MSSARNYFFVRANGQTVHNDPARPGCFVADEPPAFPRTDFDHVQYCLGYDVVRIGWPGVGDLRLATEVPDFSPCYGRLPQRTREHLLAFRSIPVGAGVLMPDKQRPGVVYAGDATLPYSYFHQPPAHPFECAHRLGVRWDRDPVTGLPADYRAADLGMSSRGGWWLWPFHHLAPGRHDELIARIDGVRRARQARGAE